MKKKSPSLTLTLSKQIKKKIHNPHKKILFGSPVPWKLQGAAWKVYYYVPHT